MTSRPTSPRNTSLANVVTLVNELRAKKDGEILLLDDGDNLQGQPLIYYYNFVATKSPSVFSEAMNRIGYDAIGLGNHDVETGHDVFDKVNKELKNGPEKAGFVCANLVNEKDGKPYFTPYVIVKKGGVKIAILGLTEPAFVKNFPKILYSGIAVEDMVVSAKKWIPVIQSKEKPDLILGLFHSGVDYSAGGATIDTPFNENAAQIVASKVPGFDAVFVGHDHAGWDGLGYDPATKSKVEVRDVNGKTVPIYGALNEARRVPVVTMTLTWNKATKKIDVAQKSRLPGYGRVQARRCVRIRLLEADR